MKIPSIMVAILLVSLSLVTAGPVRMVDELSESELKMWGRGVTIGFRPLNMPPVIPESVRLYEQVKERIPVLAVDGVPLQGLSLCKLLAKRHGPQPFFALPTDLGPDTCDLSQVILAYGGWCTAGVEDPSPVGPHFSQSLLPSVEIVQYGDTTVIYLNNYLKAHTKRSVAGEAAAVAFFKALPATLDVRSAGVALFPREYVGHLPPRAQP